MIDRLLKYAKNMRLQRNHYDAHRRSVNSYNLKHYFQKRHNLMGEFPTGSQMLDVGCGDGFVSKLLKDRQMDIVGIDLSIKTLARAYQANKKLKTVAATAECLPFKNQTFDLVYANALLHHVNNITTTVNEMIRVTKPAGRIILIEPSRKSPIIMAQAALKPVEWKVYLVSKRQIGKQLRSNYRVKSIISGDFADLFYPYHSFPFPGTRKLVDKIEQFFSQTGFCTHFYYICEVG